ncbi:sulfatase-like hydrolase/transferase [Pontiellaceae bacterium B1224]|nr:sulfatase-like hydrolase/transferase [Pontiellaceae bacterium B1224]
MIKILFRSILLACSIALPLSSFAAPITWGPATDVSAASDVSTTGDLVEAFNAGANGVANQTVNGVLFVGTGVLLNQSNGADAFSGNTGDTAYNTLLSNIDYGGGDALVSLQVGNGNLTPASSYEIQVWFVDTRNTRQTPVGDGETPNNTVTLSGNPGQFAIGNFTADGTSQTITLESPGFGNAHITAYQIRTAGPLPDPDVPTGLVATNGFTDEIMLDWNDNEQGYAFSNFIVKRSLTSGGPYTEIPGATPTKSEYIDTGLTTGQTYYYVVSTVNGDGVESADSAETSATAQIFVPAAPTVPTGLNVRPGNSRTFLGWNENTQMGFKEFRVKRSEDSGGPYTQITSTTNTYFTDTSAVNETTYYYVVTAVNVDDVESTPCAEQSATPSVDAVPPNFLFIIADDMDTYAVNAYRKTEPAETDASGNFYAIDTPNIDRLAAEGMMFHQARLMGANSGAVCTPSRTTIMSGKSTWERTSGVTAATTFPGIFNRGKRTGQVDLPHATYRTCKNGNSYAVANAEFTVVHDATKRGNTDDNGSEWHGDWGEDYIEDWNTNHRTNDTPFLIYLGFSHPHDTRMARENPDLTGRYGCINTTTPASLVVNPNAPPLPYNHLSCTPATYPAHPFDHGDLNVRDENTVAGMLQYRTEAVVRNEIGRNFACVDWIDQQIGRVLERLDDPNGDGDTSDSVMDNTYIVFTSDHGIAIGRHGLQGKQNLYEHTWRVPYIVRGPGIEPGSENYALTYLHDTFPTFCDLAGLDLPDTIDGNDGQSFRAVLEGTSDTHRDVLYGLYAGGDKPGIRAITDGRFKLMKYDVDNNGTQVTQLFDLQENPFELLPEHGVPNLATQPAYALIRQQLEERLLEKRIEYADPYAFLGDRTLLRFENTLADRFPFGNDGTAPNEASYSSDVPNNADYVVGETNTWSLDLEQDLQQYVEVPDGSGLSFGAAPYTIEAWVKLETLPSADNQASVMPVVQKKVIGAADSELDYMFLAAAGSFGDAATYSNLALRVGSTIITSTLAIPDTEWHYISVALDPVSDTVRFMLDDQIDEQSTAGTGTANTGPLVIGAHLNSASAVDSSFDGLIDELSITDGFLALEELQPLERIPEAGPFEFQSMSVVSNALSMSVETESLYLYDLESKVHLDDPEWKLEQSFIQGGTTSTTFNLPISGTETSTFYRVRTQTYRKP